MYIDESTTKRKGKTYKRVLLRRSYREDGKVKKETLLNLSDWKPTQIEAFKLALSNHQNLSALKRLSNAQVETYCKFGAFYVVLQALKKLGFFSVLGHDKYSKIVLWLIFVRLMIQGSRRKAFYLTQDYPVEELLGLKDFTLLDFYYALDWLNNQQEDLEKYFIKRNKQDKESVFLYDLTSTYLEGLFNELGAYGYNRDKKKGKLQINYGLLCDSTGDPMSVHAFKGNTADNSTVATQIDKLKNKFHFQHITLVGDKGMLKSKQIEGLKAVGFNYITTITKEQINTLLDAGVFNAGLFSEKIAELILPQEKIRYILKCNPVRKNEIRLNREQKHNKIKIALDGANQYLSEHPKAKVEVQSRNMNALIKKYKFKKWLKVVPKEGQRELVFELDQQAKEKSARLDGCYVVKTDLIDEKDISAETLHSRYKDLAKVEYNFKCQKTDYLEVRPIYLRKEERTRAHLFITMLALKVERYLSEKWKKQEGTVADILNSLDMITVLNIKFGKDEDELKQKQIKIIPKPNKKLAGFLKDIGINFPQNMPAKPICGH